MWSSLLFPVFALLSLASAKSGLISRDLTPVVAAANARIGAGAHGYTYVGCYNETTDIAGTSGARALAGGIMESNATTTTETCLKYCSDAGMKYAGLEYGQECWCSGLLSAFAVQLNESICDLACVGNTSQICGGRLALTLFNMTKTGSASALRAEGSWIYAVGAGLIASVVLVAM